MINVLTVRAKISEKVQYGHATNNKIKPVHEIIPV